VVALDLAVGLGTVGPGALVAAAALGKRQSEGSGSVAGAVVAQHTADTAYPVAMEELHRTGPEPRRPRLPESSPSARPSSPTRFAPPECLCTGRDGHVSALDSPAELPWRRRQDRHRPLDAETPWSLAILKADARASRPRADGSAGAPNPGTSWEASSEMKEVKRRRRARGRREPAPHGEPAV